MKVERDLKPRLDPGDQDTWDEIFFLEFLERRSKRVRRRVKN